MTDPAPRTASSARATGPARRDRARPGPAAVDSRRADTTVARRPFDASSDPVTPALRPVLAAESDQLRELASTVDGLRRTLDEVVRQLAAERTPRPPPADDYATLVRLVRWAVQASVPEGSTVAVVSHGDEQLLLFDGRHGWHFPQAFDGRYAGHHPADSGFAIAHLEALRSKGADYLLVPAPYRWWLEHYERFRQHLDRHYRSILDDDTCTLLSLRNPPGAQLSLRQELHRLIDEVQARAADTPTVLDWDSGLDLVTAYPELGVFAVPSGSSLPYVDDTVDVVVTGADDPDALHEARRVSTASVVVVREGVVTDVRRRNAIDEAIPRVSVELAEPTGSPFPSVSIVIPSYNGIALTEACLEALRETIPSYIDAEIVVVDDASADDTAAVLRRWQQIEPRLKVLRNRRNAGFLVTTNRGAEAAAGDILVFLNNDTVPLPGWLPPLLRTFGDAPRAGAVGGKLVFPDGRLQEAGGVVFSDGSAANFGKWDHHVDAPVYNFVREVDYCSLAFLAVRRDLWTELGGLDRAFRPIYYEDTDFCFRVWDAGWRIYYQPESVVIHLEGATSGTDEKQGDKRYQVVNRERFIARWKDALARHPENPHHYDASVWQQLAIRQAGGGA